MNHKDVFKLIRPVVYSHMLFHPLQTLQRCSYPAGLTCDFHDSTYHHAVMVESGLITFQEKNRAELVCTPGMVLIIPCNCQYQWKVHENSALTMCLHHGFNFRNHGGLAMLFGTSCRHLEVVDIGAGQTSYFSKRMEKITQMRFKDEHFSSLIFELLSLVLENADHILDQPRPPGSDNIDLVLYFIEQNLHRNPTLAELAHMACLSVSRFSRVFKTHTGHTPLQYIAGRKISRAISTLKNSNIPAGEIGDGLGFDSLNYFSRFMRKHCGMSPSEIRKKSAITQSQH
ncbi:MAG: helix-turn-helix transcriptional regulator [Victivallales bacterium]|nr:helix-turn-helix transcriptional regulator [Victivallales bacterium]